MSLGSNLLETYEIIEPSAGVVHPLPADSQEDPVAKTLLPLYHTTLKVRITITLDEYGNLCAPIEKSKKESLAIIPCTEESMGRSGKNPPPHPLCDQLQYVDKQCNSERTALYLKQLNDWRGDNIKLNAIYHYVSHHSIIKDAERQGLRLDPSENKTKTAGVCFHVQSGISNTNVTEDIELRKRWIDFQRSRHEKTGTNRLDMFGRVLQNQVLNYPKNIVSAAANAKLISAQDGNNYTFRGRFADKSEALWLDADTVQKLYVTLRWLANNHSTMTGSQAIITWAIDNPLKPVPDLQASSEDVFDDNGSLFGNEDDSEPLDTVQNALDATDVNYAEYFSRILRGYGNANILKRHAKKMAIVILDAATTGRLSVTFYRELSEGEYIEGILQWHDAVAWPLSRRFRDSNGKKQVVRFVGAPSFDAIISCASNITDHSSKSYKKFAKNLKKQLIECMFGDKILPRAILNSSYRKVTRPLAYRGADTRTGRSKWSDQFVEWNDQLEVACCLWKQYYNAENRHHANWKEITMELDGTRTDRDYLYGRLLALADDFEHSVMKKRNIDGTRPTNAVKLMSNFIAKPYTTWGSLMKQLVPYRKSVDEAVRFQNDIDDVMALFTSGEFENNKPLSPLFLLGYSHQRRYSSQRAVESKKEASNK